jgi:hypothetical protein
VRPLLILAAVLTACSPPPPRAVHPKPDPTKEAWYGETISQLAAMSREAETLLHHNAPDQAAAVITQSQPLIQRLLSASRPTLAAMEAVSDSDQLYGQMLVGNRHYVWARVFFQKNLTRWSLWTPQTPDTVRRLKLAHAAIAECERHINQ